MHQPFEVELEEGFEEVAPLPTIFVKQIVAHHKPEPDSIHYVVEFTDGAQEFIRNHIQAALYQQHMLNKTPLNRMDSGVVVEAPKDEVAHIHALSVFMEHVFEERKHAAKKYAQGDMSVLDATDDARNGASDFVAYITKYLGNWAVGFPPYNPSAIKNFRTSMIKVANLAYSGYRWANVRLNAMEIEAMAQAAGDSMTKE